MKRILTSVVMAFCIIVPLFAQPESISHVNFSDAYLSIAGPDEIYIRGISFEGETYSITITTQDEEGAVWEITELYPEEQNLAPRSMVLDFVKVVPDGTNTLTFSGIIVDGSSYEASFTIDETGTFIANTPLRQAPMPEGIIEEKLGTLKDLILEAEKEKYERKIASLMQESENKEEMIASLDKQLQQKENLIVSLSEENDDLTEEIVVQTAAIEELQEKLAAAEDSAEEARATISTLETTTPEADKNGNRIDDFNYTKTLLEGFSQSVPQLGYWNVIGDTATQTDEDQYFAKLVLPIKQQTKPTLFTFKTRSRGFGWVGTGMHIFATDNHALRGYGYGNSLLVWLTRDMEYYGTTDTRLQLYRSDDAVQMEMVLDAIIEEPLTEYLDVAILYEPEEEYITISVNGIEKLRYKTWFGIDTGLEIALRSLGGYADFKDLQVMTVK